MGSYSSLKSSKSFNDQLLDEKLEQERDKPYPPGTLYIDGVLMGEPNKAYFEVIVTSGVPQNREGVNL